MYYCFNPYVIFIYTLCINIIYSVNYFSISNFSIIYSVFHYTRYSNFSTVHFYYLSTHNTLTHILHFLQQQSYSIISTIIMHSFPYISYHLLLHFKSLLSTHFSMHQLSCIYSIIYSALSTTSKHHA